MEINSAALPCPARIMICSNEAVGLGHLRRTLTLAEYLRTHTSLASQLIITGSPVAQNFPLPQGADYIKLPSASKRLNGEYASRSIPVPFRELWDMRRDIILSAARHFRPDVLLVDHAPAGIEGEIVATLRYLKDNVPYARLALGLRDVVGEARQVRKAWARTRVYDLLDEVYDLILVYGQPDIVDVAREYGLSAQAAAKLRYTGYLRRLPDPRPVAEIRKSIGMRTDRLVVVTAGGGADGYALLRTAAEALRLRSGMQDFDCVLVTGPLMPASQREQLRMLSNNGAQVLDFVTDMTAYTGAADVVVAMGGYNTVCEILSFERPSIIVPRVAPSKEQLIRAEALAQRRLVRMLHPADLSPQRLLRTIDEALAHPVGPNRPVSLDGLPKAADELEQGLALTPVPAAVPLHETYAGVGSSSNGRATEIPLGLGAV